VLGEGRGFEYLFAVQNSVVLWKRIGMAVMKGGEVDWCGAGAGCGGGDRKR